MLAHYRIIPTSIKIVAPIWTHASCPETQGNDTGQGSNLEYSNLSLCFKSTFVPPVTYIFVLFLENSGSNATDWKWKKHCNINISLTALKDILQDN